jgi:aspartyl-tRNA synthetase
VTERTLVKQLSALADGPVRVAGWVDTVRDQKKVQFVILRDESGAVQLVHPRSGDEGEADPIAEDTSIDKRMDWRFLDLRRPELNLVFRVQTTFLHALRTWWIEHDFIEIHTPKLMASASESRAELFEVGYFEGKAYLAQSPQFFKQMAQSAGFGKIFEIGDVYRADPSFTSRHATEFTSIDAEISWIDSHEDVARMQEELLAFAIGAVADKHGAEIDELFGVTVTAPTVPFPRIPLAEAREIVAARGYEIPRTDGDLDPEGERQISAHVKEAFGHDFVFITDYPHEIRAFYHMRDAETGLTKSYDLLYNGVEITTGAQREHRVDILIEQAKQKGLEPEHLDFYFDFFRYGVPPHGGFGMGLARVLMLMLGESSIREVTYLFRGPTRLAP